MFDIFVSDFYDFISIGSDSVMNVYDFDKTIYNGDSTIDFYLYSLRKKPQLYDIFLIKLLAFCHMLVKE